MLFSYTFQRVCGNVYSNGNLIFTPDGNSVISPVGNRLTIFDLVQQTSYALPFENRKNIKFVTVSHNGRFLISVDVEGHALFINFVKRVVLSRFHFKNKVYDIKFSPNDELFAVTYRHGCQIWKTPSVQKELSPLSLSRTIGGHHDDTICIDWNSASDSIIMGSKDLSVTVYDRIATKYMSKFVLSGHRDQVVGAFFAKTDDVAYTVAADGAVFTWKLVKSEKSAILEQDASSNEESEKEDSDESESEADEVQVTRDMGFAKGKQQHGTKKQQQIQNRKPAHRHEAKKLALAKKRSAWVLQGREFLWDPHTEVTSVAYNKTNSLLVVGFNKGVFALYEMPGCVNIHRLSVSNQIVSSVNINSTGEWLAIGSSRMGQLLVWEWQSESYVLKQQGHLYGLNALDFSSDGQLIATGGIDSKVKIWNSSSGFCQITFSEHVAPVTGVKFTGKGVGKALLSCSLDGTVRAHDLLRYKNFRTMTTPTPVQFTCLAADASGEVICAGALDPFNIYVWALQTGRLLDVLTGHEGPIACLDFSAGSSTLASGSWDGTVKLWDVYSNTNSETMEHGCDVMAVAFRPDGKEVCTAATNGNIYFWDVESGAQISVIDARRDINGGRLTSDTRTSDNSARSKYFNSLSYTSDGSCILAGGKSKYTCIYAVASGTLVKKFQLSHNRSLEGVLDELRSDRLVDGVALDSLAVGDSDDEHNAYSALPGAKARDTGSRDTRPEVLTAAIRFSPTGRDWAAATTQGLQVFSLDNAMLFAPTELDVDITPQAVLGAVQREEYATAINMALHLNGEREVLKKAVDAVGVDSIDFVIKSLELRMLKDLLRFLAEEIASSRHLEYYLTWTWAVLRTHGEALSSTLAPMTVQQSMRALIRAVTAHEREFVKMCEDNLFMLNFLATQMQSASVAETADSASDGSVAVLDETVSEYHEREIVVSTDEADDNTSKAHQEPLEKEGKKKSKKHKSRSSSTGSNSGHDQVAAEKDEGEGELLRWSISTNKEEAGVVETTGTSHIDAVKETTAENSSNRSSFSNKRKKSEKEKEKKDDSRKTSLSVPPNEVEYSSDATVQQTPKKKRLSFASKLTEKREFDKFANVLSVSKTKSV